VGKILQRKKEDKRSSFSRYRGRTTFYSAEKYADEKGPPTYCSLAGRSRPGSGGKRVAPTKKLGKAKREVKMRPITFTRGKSIRRAEDRSGLRREGGDFRRGVDNEPILQEGLPWKARTRRTRLIFSKLKRTTKKKNQKERSIQCARLL